MKKKMLALGAIASLALSAQAQVYNWSLTTLGAGNPGDGSGQLTLTSGVITSMSGTLGGLSVTLLAPYSFGGNDNQLPVNFSGFAVQLSNTLRVNIYDVDGSAGVSEWSDDQSEEGTATFSYTPVPEPGTWAMGIVFGTGAVVTVGMRRRRQANVA